MLWSSVATGRFVAQVLAGDGRPALLGRREPPPDECTLPILHGHAGNPSWSRRQRCFACIEACWLKRWTYARHAGSPAMRREMRELVLRLARENSRWGYQRIVGHNHGSPGLFKGWQIHTFHGDVPGSQPNDCNVIVTETASVSFASPKSSTFTVQSDRTLMFAGFRSR